jgi:hypothetical protein
LGAKTSLERAPLDRGGKQLLLLLLLLLGRGHPWGPVMGLRPHASSTSSAHARRQAAAPRACGAQGRGSRHSDGTQGPWPAAGSLTKGSPAVGATGKRA